MRACSSCRRSLSGMVVYRRRGETFRPGSIMPTVPKAVRGKRTLCMECFRAMPPDTRRAYAVTGRHRNGRFPRP